MLCILTAAKRKAAGYPNVAITLMDVAVIVHDNLLLMPDPPYVVSDYGNDVLEVLF